MKKESNITVLKVAPGKVPEVVALRNDLHALQEAVSIGAGYTGLIEIVELDAHTCILCNEEGKLNGLEANKLLYHNGQLIDILFGNIVIVDSNDEGETISLSQEKIDKYMRVLSKCSIYI